MHLLSIRSIERIRYEEESQFFCNQRTPHKPTNENRQRKVLTLDVAIAGNDVGRFGQNCIASLVICGISFRNVSTISSKIACHAWLSYRSPHLNKHHCDEWIMSRQKKILGLSISNLLRLLVASLSHPNVTVRMSNKERKHDKRGKKSQPTREWWSNDNLQ